MKECDIRTLPPQAQHEPNTVAHNNDSNLKKHATHPKPYILERVISIIRVVWRQRLSN